MLLRSVMYIPADHARAMAKAPTLAADALVFDLEDGVSAAHKMAARKAIAALFATARPDQRCVVRINHRDTPDYEADLALVAALPIDALMLPKVAGEGDVGHVVERLSAHDRADLALWCNMETPMGYMSVQSIAAHPCVQALVAGTNDLANDLKIQRTPCRSGLMHCLQMLVLAARAHGKHVLDGTFIDLMDEAGLKAEAEQGRRLGFDGKTLIHPKQIEVVNRVFSPSAAERAHALHLIETYEAAMREGKAVTLLDGVMIEALHYTRAKALLCDV